MESRTGSALSVAPLSPDYFATITNIVSLTLGDTATLEDGSCVRVLTAAVLAVNVAPESLSVVPDNLIPSLEGLRSANAPPEVRNGADTLIRQLQR